MSALANSMPQTTLGRTGIRTSRMTVGAWGFANKAMPFANIGSEENLVATIKAALDAGVRCFDSAEVYACDALLGKIFRDLGAPMSEITVVTSSVTRRASPRTSSGRAPSRASRSSASRSCRS